MNIAKKLLEEHSKRNTLEIAGYIGTDSKRFSHLMEIYLSNNKTLAQRASMVVYHCHDFHPELTDQHLISFLDIIEGPFVHDAIKRTCLRTIRDKIIPEDYLGFVADSCFKYLNGHDEPVAIKVFSMDVLKNIVLRIPELRDELLFSLEEQLPYQSAGFKAHAKMILKEISSL